MRRDPFGHLFETFLCTQAKKMRQTKNDYVSVQRLHISANYMACPTLREICKSTEIEGEKGMNRHILHQHVDWFEIES
jgi:hypothetical protein